MPRFRLLLIGLFPIAVYGQAAKNCSGPECKQFDFWVGDWTLSFNDTGRATNTITRELDGCVVHEHFKDIKTGYTGESWSVYNKRTGKWNQTWVDNQGGYIALTGEYRNDSMILNTEPYMQNNAIAQNRMVYHNITRTTLEWNWQSTADGGKTWKDNWHIRYRRK